MLSCHLGSLHGSGINGKKGVFGNHLNNHVICLMQPCRIFCFFYIIVTFRYNAIWGCPGGSAVRRIRLPVQTQVRSLGWEDLLGEEMATHSSTLVWEIPWTEEPGGLQSTRSQESQT